MSAYLCLYTCRCYTGHPTQLSTNRNLKYYRDTESTTQDIGIQIDSRLLYIYIFVVYKVAFRFVVMFSTLYTVEAHPEKTLGTSHNALLPVRYFVQVVICIFRDETHFNYQKSLQSFMFCY